MAILALILIFIFFYGSVSFQSAIIADVALLGYNEVIGQCNFVPENLDIISFNTLLITYSMQGTIISITEST